MAENGLFIAAPTPGRRTPGTRERLAAPAVTCDHAHVNPEELAPDERAWLLESEARWRRAHAIATKHPGLDAGDVYHVLCTLHETPSQRVRRSLAHGRLRTRAR